jgi:NAD(P)-dependent dehydrogenase (short-subunit alcohol dehydrogenase family)
MELAGTTAVVTGAASGLGAATATALAARGAAVVGLDLEPALAEAAEVPGVTYLAADVTDPDDVRAAVHRAATAGPPLRLAVSCAGVAPSERVLGRKGVHDLALYAKVVSVNLVGTFHVLALAAERIAATEPDADGQRGVVVNTASIAAFDGQVGQAAYASSKGGVVGLTLAAARDLAQYGIRVLTIAPGVMETPMLAGVAEEFRAGLAAGVPFPPRLGRPEEYAGLVLALVGNDYVNGEVVRLDGALRMPPR